jgi:hypothetical protein
LIEIFNIKCFIFCLYRPEGNMKTFLMESHITFYSTEKKKYYNIQHLTIKNPLLLILKYTAKYHAFLFFLDQAYQSIITDRLAK